MGCLWSKSHTRHTRSSNREHRLSSYGVVNPDYNEQATEAASTQYLPPQPQSNTSHGVSVVDLPQQPHYHDDHTPGSSATASSSLWDRYNPDQQGLVLQSDQHRDILRDKLTDLVQSVDIRPMMPVLRQLHIIDADKQERIEFQATRVDMVMRMVDHVEQGPLWRLHGFLRALAVTNQEYLIGVLGLDPTIYEDTIFPSASDSTFTTTAQSPNSTHHTTQKQHFYRCVDSGERLEIPMGYLPGILQHCDRSQRMLMKTTLFGFDDNTPLDLTPIYINQNPDCKVNQREFLSTTMEELFLKLFQSHSPNSLLVEGDAGTGKSTFLRKYAHTCCKELLECHKKGPESPCEGHTWALVTYIPAGSITGSQEAAIRDNLLCDERLKDQVMAMIKEDGDGVLVINDAIDELRKQTEKESLRQYTISHQKDGSPKVLVSSRDSLCPIEGMFFDRHLVMKGFSLDQGVGCMQKYLRVNHHLTEHPAVDHISSNRKNFEWVLMNPLRIHILSEMIARGAITLADVKSLNTVKLLKVLEMFLVRRDEKSRGTDTDGKHSKEFYRLCLECLLNDKRTIREAAISSTSPYLAFLSKHSELDKYAKEDNFYTFSHEMFLEFMAVQGLTECLKAESVHKRAVLLLMCSDSNMRNALQLTCGHISEFEPALVPQLVFIIQACLILQTQRVVCEQNEVTEDLLKLPALIKETVSYDVLTKGLTNEQIKIINYAYKKIQKAFNQNAASLQQAGWFSNGFGEGYWKKSALHGFITGCMRQCTPSLQEEVYSQTVHKLLPCIRYNLVHHKKDGTEYNYDQFVFPTSSGRWGVVYKDIDTLGTTHTGVCAWCPSDIVQTLTELYRHQAPPTGVHGFYIDLANPASLWGVQPGEVLTHDQWVPVLCQVLTHTVDYIGIHTDHVSRTTPLCGLLTALQHSIPPTHSLTQGVHVWRGQVGEEQLQEFCEWARTVNLKVKLGYITVLLSADQDQDYVTHLHQSVQDMMINERPPTYVTPEGRTFQIPC